jgi:hypothetical protein
LREEKGKKGGVGVSEGSERGGMERRLTSVERSGRRKERKRWKRRGKR